MGTGTVKTLPGDLAGSGWYELLPPPGQVQQLSGRVEADWLIIGAGFTGLSAAKRLDEILENQTIVLVDAQRVGWGASGRNSGFMIDLPHDLQTEDYATAIEEDKKQIKMNRAAIDFARSIVEEFDLKPHWDPVGKINAATDGTGMSSLSSYSKHLDLLGEENAFVSEQEMKEMTGTDYYAGGLFTPGCVQIQPAGYVRGLAEGLKRSQRNQIRIFEDSAVIGFDWGKNKTAKFHSGEIRADKTILTVNGHLASFGYYQKQLMQVYTYGSMTRQLTEKESEALGGQASWGVTPAHPMGTTVRKLKENRIVIRNTFTYNADMKTSASQIENIGRDHDQSFRNRFPMLSDVDMEYRWGGHLCLSLNSVPVFGELEQGVFAACCQNGLGAVKGTLSGMLIAELASEQSSPLAKEMQSYEAPKKLPPEPFMSLGAKTKLWWSQLRAGKDF